LRDAILVSPDEWHLESFAPRRSHTHTHTHTQPIIVSDSDYGSVSEWWVYACLECITIVVSGGGVPLQAVCVGGANVIDRQTHRGRTDCSLVSLLQLL